MARLTKPLTTLELNRAKPKNTRYQLYDGKGLFIIITPSGGKWWRLKYRYENKECLLSLGTYPIVSLFEAREMALKLKKDVSQGTNPSNARKAKKEEIKVQDIKNENTFYIIAQKWLKSYTGQVTEDHHNKLGKYIENHICTSYDDFSIKNKSIDEITRKDIIYILEQIKSKGIDETARRISQVIQQIIKYAVTHEYMPHNIMSDIDKKVVLGKKTVKHYPALTKESDIKNLLNRIDEYWGSTSAKMALKLLPYLFVRSANIISMKWQEIDFVKCDWIIPKEQMKTREPFTLPLPQQVMNILNEIKQQELDDVLVFPSPTKKGHAITGKNLLESLRNLGYTKEQLVIHSFRNIFSTICYEYANKPNGHRYTGEVIEASMAHKEPNKVKSAYNHSTYSEAMRGLMQWYANHLDNLKTSN